MTYSTAIFTAIFSISMLTVAANAQAAGRTDSIRLEVSGAGTLYFGKTAVFSLRGIDQDTHKRANVYFLDDAAGKACLTLARKNNKEGELELRGAVLSNKQIDAIESEIGDDSPLFDKHPQAPLYLAIQSCTVVKAGQYEAAQPTQPSPSANCVWKIVGPQKKVCEPIKK